jgi:alpha-galactosidase
MKHPWDLRAAAIAVLAARVAFGDTTYEAESALLSHGARAGECASCSGGRQAMYVGGDDNGAVTFDRVQVPRGGLYPVTICYNVGDDRPLTILANGNVRQELLLKRTTRDGPSRTTVSIPLNAGTNTITLDNTAEFAPDLDCIVVAAEPTESSAIRGVLHDAHGAPVVGVEVQLSGGLEARTLTDAHGRYEFPFVPGGGHYVRPVRASSFFSPYEKFCAPGTNVSNGNFTLRDFAGRRKDVVAMKEGRWRIEYNLATGLADLIHDGNVILRGTFAAARVPETVTSLDYARRNVSHRAITDGFGRGTEYVVESANGRNDKMVQLFRLYEKTDFVVTEARVLRKPAVSCRFFAPLVSQSPTEILPPGDNRALFVPFDNDKWIRYDAVPFGSAFTSHEVSAFYNNERRQALVIGSIAHDTWKTGVRSVTAGRRLVTLEAFGGFTSTKTRDVLPHGKITSESVPSPAIFIGCFDDWRNGMEQYATANATVAPRRPWTGGRPFGWNSWGKLQFRLTFNKALQVSDFFARDLPGFKNDGVVYIGLDSGWNRFTDAQLKEFVAHCRANGQEAGIYLTPFSWWRPEDEAVPDTNYKFRDLLLRAGGEKQSLDGGLALDPTHPGTQALIEHTIDRFKRAGFTYVKADFLTHGALEADRYYDPRVTTGMQAYNYGMHFVSRCLGPDMFLNLSISPLFPGQYANCRRIACDVFGDIGKTEYELNSLTYGWWLNGVYGFNDADHVVLDGHSEGENRARVTSSVITGIFITGDDFSNDGSAAGKERARKFLTNDEVNAVARLRQTFRPIEGDTANRAGRLFACDDQSGFYLAAFNCAPTNATFRADFKRIGLKTHGTVYAKELWRGGVSRVSNSLTINLGPNDAAIYKFYRRGEVPTMSSSPSE